MSQEMIEYAQYVLGWAKARGILEREQPVIDFYLHAVGAEYVPHSKDCVHCEDVYAQN